MIALTCVASHRLCWYGGEDAYDAPRARMWLRTLELRSIGRRKPYRMAVVEVLHDVVLYNNQGKHPRYIRTVPLIDRVSCRGMDILSALITEHHDML